MINVAIFPIQKLFEFHIGDNPTSNLEQSYMEKND